MRYRLLLFGILLLLAVGRGMGYERPFPTYLALGGISPSIPMKGDEPR